MLFSVCKRLAKMLAKSIPGWRIRVKLLRFAGYNIGDLSYIGEDLLIIDEPDSKGMVNIGSRVAIAPRVTLVTSSYANYSKIRNFVGEKHGKVVVEDDAWLGTGAIILPGVTIGSCAIVAAGAVVTKNVEPFSIVAGIPASVRGKVDLPDDDETISRKTT